jgi:hypothetical protein
VKINGCIGVGTWNTQAEFKDIKVTAPDGKVLFTSDFSTNTAGWKFLGGGEWKIQDGALQQTSDKEFVRAIAGDKSWTDYTLELTARKLGGREGFMVFFHINSDRDRIWWNLGGWGNTQNGVEMGKTMDGKPGTIEEGHWYKIRIEVKAASVKCWLDGELIHDFKYRTRVVSTSALPMVNQTNGPSLVAYWLFNGNGEDATGNGHTLSFVGDPTFEQGHFSQALSLDGGSQHAQTEGPVLDTSKPFSVAAWVDWNGGGGGHPTIVSQVGRNICSFWLQKRRDGEFQMAMRDSDSTGAATGGCIVESDRVPTANMWYHVVGVYTGDEMKLYVNGKLVNSKSFSDGFASSGSLIIGAGKWKEINDHWGGLIDEVKVFNYALSDTEVAALAVARPPAPVHPAPRDVTAQQHR